MGEKTWTEKRRNKEIAKTFAAASDDEETYENSLHIFSGETFTVHKQAHASISSPSGAALRFETPVLPLDPPIRWKGYTFHREFHLNPNVVFLCSFLCGRTFPVQFVVMTWGESARGRLWTLPFVWFVLFFLSVLLHRLMKIWIVYWRSKKSKVALYHDQG